MPVATLLLALFLAVAPLAAAAQQPAAEGGGAEVTTQELEGLVSTLESEAERQKLLSDIKALIEARKAAGDDGTRTDESLTDSLLGLLSEQTAAIGRQFDQVLRLSADLPETATDLAENLQEAGNLERLLTVFGKVALVLAAALLAEWLTARILAPARTSVANRQRQSLVARVTLSLVRYLLDVVPVAVFAGVGYGIMPLLAMGEAAGVVTLAIINANVLVRVVMTLTRILFAPASMQERLLTVGDETANYSVIWIRRLTLVSVYGYFFAEVVLLLGLPSGASALLAKAIGLLVVGMLIVLLLQNRGVVAGWIRGKAAAERDGKTLPGLRGSLAEIWHILAIVFLFAAYVVWALDIEGGSQFLFRAAWVTIAVLIGARLAAALVDRGLQRGFSLRDELKLKFPGLEKRANRYLTGLRHVLKLAIVVVAAAVLLDAWGLDIFGWLTSGTGGALASRAASILVVLILAAAAWELVTAVIERYLEQQDGTAAAPSARARTLLPLLRNVVRIVLAVLVVLTVLSELGVNIAPLLAGAGVVGLAIGFGAQSLVKDVITGGFILFEDAISVGDVVEVAGHAGIVEGMTIRSVRLRDLSGNVHVVPFGEVTAVLNMTKEFSYALMDVGVAYREDVDEVVEVLKEVAESMRADETCGPDILEPLEVLGLDSFGDSAVVIRIRIKTRPIKQWGIKREFNRRMKRVFDEKGIEIPFPHQTLYFGVDKDGSAPPGRILLEREAARQEAAAAPAAAETVQAEIAPQRGDEPIEGRPDGAQNEEDGPR